MFISKHVGWVAWFLSAVFEYVRYFAMCFCPSCFQVSFMKTSFVWQVLLPSPYCGPFGLKNAQVDEMPEMPKVAAEVRGWDNPMSYNIMCFVFF